MSNSDVLVDQIRPEDFHWVSQMCREFFVEAGFIEAGVQHRQSILAACENPFSIATYNFRGEIWPLPQTGQMHLEHELLRYPKRKGLFCVTTSYREEPEPKAGRHNLSFPMVEFETHGGLVELRELLGRLINHLGFVKGEVPWIEYYEYAKLQSVSELTDEHEMQIEREYGSAALLANFPLFTSPFWNMRIEGVNGVKTAKKIDAIICGIETIGSAERSCDSQQMRKAFYTVSGGNYAKALFAKFGRDRVSRELEDFLALSFFPRCGGGIGVTRLIRAAKQRGIIVT